MSRFMAFFAISVSNPLTFVHYIIEYYNNIAVLSQPVFIQNSYSGTRDMNASKSETSHGNKREVEVDR